MSKTNKLVALIFDETTHAAAYQGGQVWEGAAIQVAHPTRALAALDEIEKRAKRTGVELRDAVIAFKSGEGRIKITQTRDLTTGKAAGRGGLLGLLVGLIFGGPLLGAVLGLGLGAIRGKRADRGLDNEFIRRVGSSLKPNHSALLVMIDQEYADKAVDYLQSFEVEMHVTDISEDTEEALGKAAEDEQIAKAVEDEYGAEA
jgi:uncharacterized membrane protein